MNIQEISSDHTEASREIMQRGKPCERSFLLLYIINTRTKDMHVIHICGTFLLFSSEHFLFLYCTQKACSTLLQLIRRKIASRRAAKTFKNDIVLFIFGFACVRNSAILLKENNLPLFLVSLPCSYRKLTPFCHLLLFFADIVRSLSALPSQLWTNSRVLGLRQLQQRTNGKRQYMRKRQNIYFCPLVIMHLISVTIVLFTSLIYQQPNTFYSKDPERPRLAKCK